MEILAKHFQPSVMTILIILAIGIPLGSAMMDGQKIVIKNYEEDCFGEPTLRSFAIYDKDENVLRGGAGDGGSLPCYYLSYSVHSKVISESGAGGGSGIGHAWDVPVRIWNDIIIYEDGRQESMSEFIESVSTYSIRDTQGNVIDFGYGGY